MTDLAQQYRRRGALIDTNILLLFFVGSFRRDLIGQRRTEKFVPEDFDLVLEVLDYFAPIVTTPNVLTEVNNLVPNSIGPSYFEHFATGISLLREEYQPSSEVTTIPAFRTVGLTDAGIIQAAAKNRYLVITDDWKLRQFLQHAGLDALNFEELRFQNWT